MKRISRYLLPVLAGGVVFSVGSGQLSAQTFTLSEERGLIGATAPPPSTSAAEEPKVLISDEAGRVGVEPSRNSENVPAAAAQTAGGTAMKWVIIIGLAVISALFILAIADIGNI